MKNNHNKWRLNRIAGALAVALLPLCDEVLAREVFNPALLEMDGPHTGVRDLSAYEKAGGQLPGTYRVDIYLNKRDMVQLNQYINRHFRKWAKEYHLDNPRESIIKK